MPTSEMMKVRTNTIKENKHRGQIKTILNQVQKFKSFVYGEARLLSNIDQLTWESGWRSGVSSFTLIRH